MAARGAGTTMRRPVVYLWTSHPFTEVFIVSFHFSVFWHDPKDTKNSRLGLRLLGYLLFISTTGSTTPSSYYTTGVVLSRQTSLTTCREIVDNDNR